jgi:catalase (peroxidase I)
MELIKNKMIMKTNQEILNFFGRIIIEDCFDPTYANIDSIKNRENPPQFGEEYSNLFKKLSDSDFEILKKYISTSLGALLFDVLRIFEEHKEFKLTYEDDDQQVDLTKISDSLMTEPIIENGWIERFSKFNLKQD